MVQWTNNVEHSLFGPRVFGPGMRYSTRIALRYAVVLKEFEMKTRILYIGRLLLSIYVSVSVVYMCINLCLPTAYPGRTSKCAAPTTTTTMPSGGGGFVLIIFRASSGQTKRVPTEYICMSVCARHVSALIFRIISFSAGAHPLWTVVVLINEIQYLVCTYMRVHV